MPSSSEAVACRVCGWPHAEPPWGADGKSPTYDICVCCGAEAGYEDCTPDAARRYRQRWVERGCPWFVPDKRPADWDLEQRVQAVPEAYR